MKKLSDQSMAALERMHRAQHAMQSAIGLELTHDLRASDVAGVHPDSEAARFMKHLRVGVNTAMGEQGGLGRLLIAKGIITEEEYFLAMAEAMEMEAEQARQITIRKCGLPDTTQFG